MLWRHEDLVLEFRPPYKNMSMAIQIWKVRRVTGTSWPARKNREFQVQWETLHQCNRQKVKKWSTRCLPLPPHMLTAAPAMTHTHAHTACSMHIYPTHLHHMHTQRESLQPCCFFFNLRVRLPLILVISVTVKTDAIHRVQTRRPECS